MFKQNFFSILMHGIVDTPTSPHISPTEFQTVIDELASLRDQGIIQFVTESQIGDMYYMPGLASVVLPAGLIIASPDGSTDLALGWELTAADAATMTYNSSGGPNDEPYLNVVANVDWGGIMATQFVPRFPLTGRTINLACNLRTTASGVNVSVQIHMFEPDGTSTSVNQTWTSGGTTWEAFTMSAEITARQLNYIQIRFRPELADTSFDVANVIVSIT